VVLPPSGDRNGPRESAPVEEHDFRSGEPDRSRARTESEEETDAHKAKASRDVPHHSIPSLKRRSIQRPSSAAKIPIRVRAERAQFNKPRPSASAFVRTHGVSSMERRVPAATNVAGHIDLRRSCSCDSSHTAARSTTRRAAVSGGHDPRRAVRWLQRPPALKCHHHGGPHRLWHRYQIPGIFRASSITERTMNLSRVFRPSGVT